jgi:hypothetical protein
MEKGLRQFEKGSISPENPTTINLDLKTKEKMNLPLVMAYATQ